MPRNGLTRRSSRDNQSQNTETSKNVSQSSSYYQLDINFDPCTEYLRLQLQPVESTEDASKGKKSREVGENVGDAVVTSDRPKSTRGSRQTNVPFSVNCISVNQLERKIRTKSNVRSKHSQLNYCELDLLTKINNLNVGSSTVPVQTHWSISKCKDMQRPGVSEKQDKRDRKKAKNIHSVTSSIRTPTIVSSLFTPIYPFQDSVSRQSEAMAKLSAESRDKATRKDDEKRRGTKRRSASSNNAKEATSKVSEQFEKKTKHKDKDGSRNHEKHSKREHGEPSRKKEDSSLQRTSPNKQVGSNNVDKPSDERHARNNYFNDKVLTANAAEVMVEKKHFSRKNDCEATTEEFDIDEEMLKTVSSRILKSEKIRATIQNETDEKQVYFILVAPDVLKRKKKKAKIEVIKSEESVNVASTSKDERKRDRSNRKERKITEVKQSDSSLSHTQEKPTSSKKKTGASHKRSESPTEYEHKEYYRASEKKHPVKEIMQIDTHDAMRMKTKQAKEARYTSNADHTDQVSKTANKIPPNPSLSGKCYFSSASLNHSGDFEIHKVSHREHSRQALRALNSVGDASSAFDVNSKLSYANEDMSSSPQNTLQSKKTEKKKHSKKREIRAKCLSRGQSTCSFMRPKMHSKSAETETETFFRGPTDTERTTIRSQSSSNINCKSDIRSHQSSTNLSFRTDVKNKNGKLLHPEVSFSKLNLQPVVSYYTSPSKILDLRRSASNTAQKQRLLVVNSAAKQHLSPYDFSHETMHPSGVTKRDNEQFDLIRYFATASKHSRLKANHHPRNLVCTENIIETARKPSANASTTIGFVVEGIEPPKRLGFADTTPINSISTKLQNLHKTVFSVIEIQSSAPIRGVQCYVQKIDGILDDREHPKESVEFEIFKGVAADVKQTESVADEEVKIRLEKAKTLKQTLVKMGKDKIIKQQVEVKNDDVLQKIKVTRDSSRDTKCSKSSVGSATVKNSNVHKPVASSRERQYSRPRTEPQLVMNATNNVVPRKRIVKSQDNRGSKSLAGSETVKNGSGVYRKPVNNSRDTKSVAATESVKNDRSVIRKPVTHHRDSKCSKSIKSEPVKVYNCIPCKSKSKKREAKVDKTKNVNQKQNTPEKDQRSLSSQTSLVPKSSARQFEVDDATASAMNNAFKQRFDAVIKDINTLEHITEESQSHYSTDGDKSRQNSDKENDQALLKNLNIPLKIIDDIKRMSSDVLMELNKLLEAKAAVNPEFFAVIEKAKEISSSYAEKTIEKIAQDAQKSASEVVRETAEPTVSNAGEPSSKLQEVAVPRPNPSVIVEPSKKPTQESLSEVQSSQCRVLKKEDVSSEDSPDILQGKHKKRRYRPKSTCSVCSSSKGKGVEDNETPAKKGDVYCDFNPRANRKHADNTKPLASSRNGADSKEKQTVEKPSSVKVSPVDALADTSGSSSCDQPLQNIDMLVTMLKRESFTCMRQLEKRLNRLLRIQDEVPTTTTSSSAKEAESRKNKSVKNSQILYGFEHLKATPVKKKLKNFLSKDRSGNSKLSAFQKRKIYGEYLRSLGAKHSCHSINSVCRMMLGESVQSIIDRAKESEDETKQVHNPMKARRRFRTVLPPSNAPIFLPQPHDVPTDETMLDRFLAPPSTKQTTDDIKSKRKKCENTTDTTDSSANKNPSKKLKLEDIHESYMFLNENSIDAKVFDNKSRFESCQSSASLVNKDVYYISDTRMDETPKISPPSSPCAKKRQFRRRKPCKDSGKSKVQSEKRFNPNLRSSHELPLRSALSLSSSYSFCDKAAAEQLLGEAKRKMNLEEIISRTQQELESLTRYVEARSEKATKSCHKFVSLSAYNFPDLQKSLSYDHIKCMQRNCVCGVSNSVWFNDAADNSFSTDSLETGAKKIRNTCKHICDTNENNVDPANGVRKQTWSDVTRSKVTNVFVYNTEVLYDKNSKKNVTKSTSNNTADTAPGTSTCLASSTIVSEESGYESNKSKNKVSNFFKKRSTIFDFFRTSKVQVNEVSKAPPPAASEAGTSKTSMYRHFLRHRKEKKSVHNISQKDVNVISHDIKEKVARQPRISSTDIAIAASCSVNAQSDLTQCKSTSEYSLNKHSNDATDVGVLGTRKARSISASLDSIEKEMRLRLPSPVSLSLSATQMLESSVESYDSQFFGDVTDSYSRMQLQNPVRLYYLDKKNVSTCFKNFMNMKKARPTGAEEKKKKRKDKDTYTEKTVSCCTSFDDHRIYSKADKVACTDHMTGRKTCTYTNTEGETFVCNDPKNNVSCGCSEPNKIPAADCATMPDPQCPCTSTLGTDMFCVKKNSLTEYKQYAQSLRDEADAKKGNYLKQYNDFQEKLGNPPPPKPSPDDKKGKCVCPSDLLDRIKTFQKNVNECQEYAQKVRIQSDLRKEGLQKDEPFQEVPLNMLLGKVFPVPKKTPPTKPPTSPPSIIVTPPSPPADTPPQASSENTLSVFEPSGQSLLSVPLEPSAGSMGLSLDSSLKSSKSCPEEEIEKTPDPVSPEPFESAPPDKPVSEQPAPNEPEASVSSLSTTLNEEDETEELKVEEPPNMTDKELFDKLLESYEKEDDLVERLSQDDEFFESQLALVKSQESVRNFLVEKPAAAPEEPKSIVGKMFKRKDTVKEIVAPKDEDTSSIDQTSVIEGADARVEENIQHEIEEDIREMRGEETNRVQFSKGSELFEREKVVLAPEPLHRKDTDHDVRYTSNVNAREIGKCFRRGFRPDNLALSGEPCLNVDLKEQMRRVDPGSVDERGSIIDFSERETPLEYLLGLGFSVDEASNAIKDEDVRNRLNAAITEVS